MEEIVPGVFHWTAFHEGIRAQVSSYYLRDAGAVIDPLLPSDDALGWLSEHGPPQTVLLTNRHHYRHSGRIVDAFDVPVRASRPGMHEFSAEQRVEPFDFGDELPGGLIAHEVGAICPDETALHIPAHRALACADGVVQWAGNDGLSFVPDYLMDDPEHTKAALEAAYRSLLELDFELLLLAHGEPLNDGKRALARFVGDGA
jgi:hypothetical protein